jgi:Carboxypeptidase regulatory-like domain
MINRNVVRSATLAVVALMLFSASIIARSSDQKPSQQTEASLMAAGQGIPDVDVVLKKKPGGNSVGNNRTDKDGSFSFENVPVGTYNLTFGAPKLSPVMAGKVEVLVIVQQSEVRGADSSTAKTYTDSKLNTVKRIAVAKIKDGFDFTVGLQPQEGAINTSKSNIKNNPTVTDSQTRKAKESKEGNAAQAVNVRGKISLVEIGTNNMAIDEPGVKATSASRGGSAAVGAPKKSFASREQNHRLRVSFYSIGSGVDGEARKSLNEYISSYEKAKAVKLAREEVQWGREGEIDYCLHLTEIAPKEQERVIGEIKALLKRAKFVRIEENVACRNKR